jgi:hypothetical protein
VIPRGAPARGGVESMTADLLTDALFADMEDSILSVG